MKKSKEIKRDTDRMFLGINGFEEIESLFPETPQTVAQSDSRKRVTGSRSLTEATATLKTTQALHGSRKAPAHMKRTRRTFKKRTALAAVAVITAIMMSCTSLSAFACEYDEDTFAANTGVIDTAEREEWAYSACALYIDGNLVGYVLDDWAVREALEQILIEARAGYDESTTTCFNNTIEMVPYCGPCEYESADSVVAAARDMLSIRLETDWYDEDGEWNEGAQLYRLVYIDGKLVDAVSYAGDTTEAYYDAEETYDDAAYADDAYVTDDAEDYAYADDYAPVADETPAAEDTLPEEIAATNESTVADTAENTYNTEEIVPLPKDEAAVAAEETPVAEEPAPEVKEETPAAPVEETPKAEETPQTEEPAPATVTAVSSDGFIWPLPHTHNITSEMGERWGRMHNGIDIAGGDDYGQPFLAADDGTVIWAGNDGGGYGNYVMIDHGNGYVTVYGHASDLNCVTGQTVKQGDVIGYVGSTGNSTGPHLHFEIRENGEYMNPLNYVS